MAVRPGAANEGVKDVSEETHDVVRARTFELVDEGGATRAPMGSAPNGAVGLEMYGDDRTTRLTVGINPEGTARVDLRDATGTTQARLAVEASGTPATLNIRDAEGTIRAQVAMHDGEALGVSLADGTGRPLAQIMVDPDGYASVTLEDANGEVTSGFDNATHAETEPAPDMRIDRNSDTFLPEAGIALAERLHAETDLIIESEVPAYLGIDGEPPTQDVVIYVLHHLIPLADLYKNVLASAIWDLIKAAFARRGAEEPGGTGVRLIEVEKDGSF